MKKVGLAILILGVSVGLAACGSNGDKTEKTKETTEQSIEDTATKEDKKMEAMEEDLDEKGVSIRNTKSGYIYFTREKSIDYDYFKMTFKFSKGQIFKVNLELKGNVDGKMKDDLHYEVSKGRMVESSIYETNINTLAEVLESIDYSDKELLEFAQWYYDKEK